MELYIKKLVEIIESCYYDYTFSASEFFFIITIISLIGINRNKILSTKHGLGENIFCQLNNVYFYISQLSKLGSTVPTGLLS